MSKDSNKNNLEDFFRNSLQNYSENPSNDLWDRIEESIPAKPSRKLRPAYALLALLLLLTIGLGYEYFQFKNQMLSVNETVTKQNEELDELKDQLEAVKDQLQSTLETSTPPMDDEPTSEIIIKENQVISSINKLGAVLQSNPDLKNASIVDLGLIKENNVSKTDLVISENQNNPIQFEAPPTGEPTSLMVPSLIATKSVAVSSTNEINLPVLAVSEKKRKEFSVELFASAYKTFPNNASSKKNPSKVKNWKLSSDFGALFNLGVSKNWDVQIGVGYDKMVINDAVVTDLSYSRDELDPSRGIYTSYYSYTINTPSGEMEVNTALSNQRINDGRDIEEGDPFKLDLQYQDEVYYFQLPVFVRYKIGKGKYRFTLKSGIIQKFLLNEKIKLSAVDAGFDRLQNDMTHISSSQNSAATTSLDALLGAGAEFRLTANNSVHLQSIFKYSLKEIYSGTKPFSIGLQLGFQHKLNR